MKPTGADSARRSPRGRLRNCGSARRYAVANGCRTRPRCNRDGEHDDVSRREQLTEKPRKHWPKFAATLRYDDLPERVREHCKNLLLDALACAVAGHRARRPARSRRWPRRWRKAANRSVIGGGRLSLAGATLLNGYLITAVTMCDVHRATMTHVTPEIVPPALAIAERDGLSGPRSSGRHRRRLRSDDADRHRPRLSGVSRAAAGMARASSARSVPPPRSARCLSFDADTMARAFGLAGSQAAGTFAAWGTPTVKFHQCRGALSGPDGGAAGAAKFRRHPRIPHRQGRRPLQRLCQWRQTGCRGRRSRQALRARADRAAAVAVGDADPGPEHGAVRYRRPAQHRFRARAQGARRAQPERVRHAWRLWHLQGQIRGAVVGALHGGGHPARPRADLGAVRSPTVTTIRSCGVSPPKRSRSVPMRAVAGSQARVDSSMDDGRRTLSARCEHPLGSSENPLSRPQIEQKFTTYAQGVSARRRYRATSSRRSTGWRISARCAS